MRKAEDGGRKRRFCFELRAMSETGIHFPLVV